MATIPHTLIALVENKPGVLNRVASLFRRRGFNIESIAVGHSEIPGLSRMIIVVDGANVAVEQVRKQLEKVIEVVKVTDIPVHTWTQISGAKRAEELSYAPVIVRRLVLLAYVNHVRPTGNRYANDIVLPLLLRLAEVPT